MGQAESSTHRRKRPYSSEGNDDFGNTDRRVITRSSTGQIGSNAAPSRYESRPIRRPFGRLCSSQPSSSSSSRHARVDEHRLQITAPIDLAIPVGAGALVATPPPTLHGHRHHHETMNDPTSSSSQHDLDMSEGSQPNKVFKLDVCIDSSDGTISGKVRLGSAGGGPTVPAGPHLMDIPTQICTVCHGQMDNIQTDRRHSQQMETSEILTVEEMNQLYDRNETHYLHKLDSELTKQVGNLNCFEIVGLTRERLKIKDIIFHRLQNIQHFEGPRKYSTTGIVLSGERGDGKTLIAKLIAGHFNHRYINVEPHFFDSTNKYKRLMGIFRLARQQQPSVIVFESADMMFGPYNKKLQQLFVSEFQASAENGDKILIIATMNKCYHNLPPRIDECFEYKLVLPSPEEDERRDLTALHMRGVKHSLSTRDFKTIAELTRYYSRAQVIKLCNKASTIPLYEVPHDLLEETLQSAIRPVMLDDFAAILRRGPEEPEPLILKSSSSSQSSDSSSDETLVSANQSDPLQMEDIAYDEVD